MRVRLLIFLLCAVCAGAFAQQPDQPLASFTGTVRQINSTSLTLIRPDQEDLDISCTHKTHYYKGGRKIGRSQIKPGDRVSVETRLDLYLKPEAVNVRLLPPDQP